MMKKKSPQSARQAIRLMMMVLALVALPFGLKKLEQKFNARMIASHDDKDNRSPASVDRFDLSLLDQKEFMKAFKYQMLGESLVISTPDSQGVRLGHFIMSDSDGKAVFACEKFGFVELIYSAEGIAISGEIPKMIVRGPCNESDDQKTIEALMIPFQEILKAPLNQAQFRFPIAGRRDNISLFFTNVVEKWPTLWNLTGVKLYSDKSSETLEINGYEIISVMGEPMTLNFQVSE
jgi:hypothetical protein